MNTPSLAVLYILPQAQSHGQALIEKKKAKRELNGRE
jgi:hypothetical protein